MHNIGEIWNCAETWFSPIWSTRRKEAAKQITSNKKLKYFIFLDASKLFGQRVEKKQRKIQLGSKEHLKSGWGRDKTSGIGGSPRKISIKKLKQTIIQMQINTMKKYVELISSLQAHHLNIYVGANFSPFVPRQKKMVV